MSGIMEAAGEGIAVLMSKIGTCSSTPLVSGAIDCLQFDQILCLFQTGDMASETIDFKVQMCDSDGTSNLSDLKAATQLAAHASDNDNKVVAISVRTEKLTTGKRYIRMYGVTGNTVGGSCAFTAIGIGAKYGPASDHDAAAVVQIKHA